MNGGNHSDRADLCLAAPWMRNRLPLAYVGERVAAVANLWVEVELAAPPGVAALKPVWSGRPLYF